MRNFLVKTRVWFRENKAAVIILGLCIIASVSACVVIYHYYSLDNVNNQAMVPQTASTPADQQVVSLDDFNKANAVAKFLVDQNNELKAEVAKLKANQIVNAPTIVAPPPPVQFQSPTVMSPALAPASVAARQHGVIHWSEGTNGGN